MSGIPKFVCEAKRPGINIENFAFDTQNYAANSGVYIGILTDFEWLIVYAVGAAPRATNPFPHLHGWKLHYSEFIAKAEEIWRVFSKDSVAQGLLDQFIYSLEKVPSLRLKQGWLFRPERNRAIDQAFLAYLLEQRQVLARALLNRNTKAVIASEDDLNGSVQTIMGRILFQRVCEDRDIDTHQTLERILDGWRAGGRKRGQLWTVMKANFSDMKTTFNGGLYDTAFVDSLDVSERWIEDFVDQLCDPQSNYQFKTMPVEILGSVYEQFLCYRLDLNGNMTLKPEIAKSGGIIYTPEFIVDAIVREVVIPRIEGRAPEALANVKIVDPACGSGTFLLAAFEAICLEALKWYSESSPKERSKAVFVDQNGDLHLTTGEKRRFLLSCIFGLDKDAQAVEVI